MRFCLPHIPLLQLCARFKARKGLRRFPRRKHGGFALMAGLIFAMIVGSFLLTIWARFEADYRAEIRAISIGNIAANLTRDWQSYLLYDGPARLGVDAGDPARLRAAYLTAVPAAMFGGPAGQALRPSDWIGGSSIEIAEGVSARFLGACPPNASSCLGVVELHTDANLKPSIRSYLDDWLRAELAARGAQDWLIAQDALWSSLGVGSSPTSLYMPGTAFFQLDERAVLRYDFFGLSAPIGANIDMGGNSAVNGATAVSNTVSGENGNLGQLRARSVLTGSGSTQDAAVNTMSTASLTALLSLSAGSLTFSGAGTQFGSALLSAGAGSTGVISAPSLRITDRLSFANAQFDRLNAPALQVNDLLANGVTVTAPEPITPRLQGTNLGTTTLISREGQFSTITTQECNGC